MELINLHVTFVGRSDACPADMLWGFLIQRMPKTHIIAVKGSQKLFVTIPWWITDADELDEKFNNGMFMAGIVSQIVNYFGERELIPDGWGISEIRKIE